MKLGGPCGAGAWASAGSGQLRVLRKTSFRCEDPRGGPREEGLVAVTVLKLNQLCTCRGAWGGRGCSRPPAFVRTTRKSQVSVPLWLPTRTCRPC